MVVLAVLLYCLVPSGCPIGHIVYLWTLTVRILGVFRYKNALSGMGQNVGQPPDPHCDPHNEMCGKSQRAPERRLCLLSGIFAPFFCLHDLRHEVAHCLCGFVLLLPCGVGVGSQGESRVIVTEH